MDLHVIISVIKLTELLFEKNYVVKIIIIDITL